MKHAPQIFWISLAGAVAVGAVILFFQASDTRKTAQQVENAKQAVEELERDHRNLQNASAAPSLLRSLPTAKERKAAAVAEARAATTPAERVKQTREKLLRLVSGVGNLREGPGKFFRILPDLLRVVEDLSVEELIEVAEGMKLESAGRDEPQTITRMILLALAGEQDPQRVMRNPEMMKDRQMREMLLGTLARRDPEAARRWVEASDMSDREKQEFASVLAFKTLRTDLDAGLKLLRENKAAGNTSFGPSDAMPVDKALIPDLLVAMKKPENADVLGFLEKLMLSTAMLDGGVKSAREQVEAMDLSKEELGAFLERNRHQLVNTQPEETLAWLRDVQSPEDQAKLLPDMVGSWAERDFNAAGEWLGRMEASPVKDATIERYVQTVVRVDPQAALVWAGTISESGMRAIATVSAVEQWIARDRPAAENWMAENGVDLESLRGRIPPLPEDGSTPAEPR